MIVYGRNPVREALAGRRAAAVERVWATRRAAREPWLGGRRAVPVEVVSEQEVSSRCGSDAHQGLCAEAGPFPYASAADLVAVPGTLLLALDEVADPQNLGAVCRSAECAGAGGVVIPERRAASVTPAVCRASAGAVEHLRVARVRNLVDFLSEAKAAGGWCYGAAAEGAQPYHELDWKGTVVLVLGGEGRGLRPRVRGACDALAAIPLRGRTQSLNVAAAAAVLLYGALHQREGLDRAP